MSDWDDEVEQILKEWDAGTLDEIHPEKYGSIEGAEQDLADDIQAVREEAIMEKAKTRVKTTEAIRRGDMIRPDACEDCEEPKPVEAHHTDYTSH
jgi:hypothetical protein